MCVEQKFQENLNERGKDGSTLDATISLLQYSSEMIELFNDKLPISSLTDSRMKRLNDFYLFLTGWRDETKDNNEWFISLQLWFDLQSMALGFTAMVATKLAQFPNATIKPSLVNQDCVENHFCQVRSCNGQNNNPTYLQQEATQNSIRFGQTTVSRKSNAGRTTESLSSCELPVRGKS